MELSFLSPKSITSNEKYVKVSLYHSISQEFIDSFSNCMPHRSQGTGTWTFMTQYFVFQMTAVVWRYILLLVSSLMNFVCVCARACMLSHIYENEIQGWTVEGKEVVLNNFSLCLCGCDPYWGLFIFDNSHIEFFPNLFLWSC